MLPNKKQPRNFWERKGNKMKNICKIILIILLFPIALILGCCASSDQ